MPLTQEQLQFEQEWAKRWLAAFRTLKKERFVDPFYHDDAKLVRAHKPTVEGVAAIRAAKAQIGLQFNAVETDNASIVIDEKEACIVILCDMTMVLKPDPEQKRLSTSAAIVIKKPLGDNEEKMLQEQVILDSSLLAQRFAELGIDPRKFAEH